MEYVLHRQFRQPWTLWSGLLLRVGMVSSRGLITPFIFLAYAKNKKLGFLITVLIFFASVLTAFILVLVNKWRYPIFNPKLAPQP
jgi:hypothetical protein